MLPSVCVRERQRPTERQRERRYLFMCAQETFETHDPDCLEKEEMVGWGTGREEGHFTGIYPFSVF